MIIIYQKIKYMEKRPSFIWPEIRKNIVYDPSRPFVQANESKVTKKSKKIICAWGESFKPKSYDKHLEICEFAPWEVDEYEEDTKIMGIFYSL